MTGKILDTAFDGKCNLMSFERRKNKDSISARCIIQLSEDAKLNLKPCDNRIMDFIFTDRGVDMNGISNAVRKNKVAKKNMWNVCRASFQSIDK